MKYFSLAALLVLFAIASCNKTPTSTSTVESTLRNGKWKLSSGTLSMRLPNGKDTSLDYYNLIVPACHKDDYIDFSSGLYGGVFSNTIKCDASDPDSVGFAWTLSNNNTSISIYNSQNFYFAAQETILPYHIDTISHSPLQLDSLTYSGGPSKVDSIYNLYFNEIPAPATNINNLTDIDGAKIVNLTSSSLTLTFSVFGSVYVYPDSTNFHAAYPIIRADTFHYSLTYTNF
jgi:hypothetical protein